LEWISDFDKELFRYIATDILNPDSDSNEHPKSRESRKHNSAVTTSESNSCPTSAETTVQRRSCHHNHLYIGQWW